MSMEHTNPEVSADVLIHNFGKKPNKEVKAKIMDFIEAHKEETMQLTEESLPVPDAPPRPQDDPLYGRYVSHSGLDDNDDSDEEGSPGEASPSS